MIFSCAWVVSVVSVWLRVSHYQSIQHTIQNSPIGTGEIIENSGGGRYVFRDTNSRKYIYYSDQIYEVGTTLYAFSSPQPPLSGGYDLWQKFSWNSFSEKMSIFLDPVWGFDMTKRMILHEYVGVVYEKKATLVPVSSSSFSLIIRQSLLDLIAHAYGGRVRGLTAGMLIGDRARLTKEDYQGFVDSGLVHIIAVSGGNIVLLVSFISLLLFFLPYYIRLSFIALAVLLYASICGRDGSIVRATLMALVTIGSLFFGRPVDTWRSIGYVFTAMIIRNPYYLLYDLGFIFSFSALSGLVFFGKQWSGEQKKHPRYTPKHLCRRGVLYLRNGYILPTFSATLGMIAPLLFFTGHINLVSILSNLFIIPLVPVVMIYGFFSTIIYSVTLWKVVLVPQIWLVDRIYWISEKSLRYGLFLTAYTGRARCVVLVFALITIAILTHLLRKKEYQIKR